MWVRVPPEVPLLWRSLMVKRHSHKVFYPGSNPSVTTNQQGIIVHFFEKMHPQLIRLCHQYFRLAKLAANGFDPLAALLDAKQEASENNQIVTLLNNIGFTYSQLANIIIADPKHNINKSIQDLKNAQNAYNKLINQVSQLHDFANDYPAVGYYTENILNDANIIISKIQQTSLAFASSLPANIRDKYINAVLSASDDYISDEELAAQEEAYGISSGIEPEEGEEEEAGFKQNLFDEEDEEDDSEEQNQFAEIAEEAEGKLEMAYNVRRERILKTKKDAWNTLFDSARPRNPELWKEIQLETERRFGETLSTNAKSWAWQQYAQQGGQWDLYKDIHAKREALRRAKMTEDPEKYKKYLESGRERSSRRYHELTEEQKKQRRKQQALQKKEKRKQQKLDKELEQLKQMFRQSFFELSRILRK